MTSMLETTVEEARQESPSVVPVRVAVYNAQQFAEAERAAKELADHGIPQQDIKIMALGLRWVPGRDRGTAAARAARDGAAIGALVAFCIWMLSLGDVDIGPVILCFVGAATGAIAGFLAGAWRYWWTSSDETVPETGRVQAGRYDVLVAERHAESARRRLSLA